MNPETIWRKYGKMIMKIAHDMSKKYDMPYDELLSEGILGIFDKLPDYNKTRSSLCTYIYRCAYFKMLDYCIIPPREIPTDVYGNEERNPFAQKEIKQNNWLHNFLNELSEEAQHLVKIIFESPEELYRSIKSTSPIRSKKALKNYMIDVEDWTAENVNKIFQEVVRCL